MERAARIGRPAFRCAPCGLQIYCYVQLAKLKPHLQEALMMLEHLERQRILSGREKTRVGALRMLLTSIERIES